MKRLLNLLLVLLLVVSVNAQQKLKRFAVKSGHITYELSGNTSGTKEVWWKDYGNQYYEEVKSKTVTKMFGIKSEEEAHTILINKGKEFWSVDLLNKTGVKGELPMYEEVGEMTEEQAKQMSDQMLDNLGGERLPNEKFMGYTCEVIKLMGSKVWTYKGVPLKSEAKIMGITANEKAIKFDKNVSVKMARFTPPKSVSYQDQSDTYAQMGNAFGEMGYTEDESEEEDESNDPPLTYPFAKFQEKVSKLNYNSYKKVMVQDQSSRYMANFMKGFGNSISIIATHWQKESLNEIAKDEGEEYETFRQNGKTCHFGKLDNGVGTSLIIEYPKYNMAIVYMGVPALAKNELVKLSNQLKF